MNRKKLFSRKNMIAFAIFVALIIGSGVALAHAGYMENPVAVYMNLFNSNDMTAAPEGALTEGRVPPDGMDASFTLENIAGERPDPSAIQIQWSEFVSVFYNVWVMCLVTAIVMVVQLPLGYLMKHLKPSRRKVPVTA